MDANDVARLARHGGNSVRTWSVDNRLRSAADLLDEAQGHDVTVALGLPVTPERAGFNYDDPVAIAGQLETVRDYVRRYRNHPALLLWIIGNELNLEHSNPKVWNAVNAIAEMIHKEDPDHPVTTTLAGFPAAALPEIEQRTPALDFLSFQIYGALVDLPRDLEKAGYDRPFMVTEWGTTGHWEVETTRWGAPIEPTSTVKAFSYRRGYEQVLAKLSEQLLGSYVFLWGQKQERTPTWYGMFTEEGAGTESVDVMHYLWTGQWPENRSPTIGELSIDGRKATDSVTVSAGSTGLAKIPARSLDGNRLRYRWSVKPETSATAVGGDYEGPVPDMDGLIDDPAATKIRLLAPPPGKYRLYVYVYDEHGHAAHANLPFLVE